MFFLCLFACRNEPIAADNDLVLLAQLESAPEKARLICPQLQNEQSLSHCQSIAKRPHLWANPKTQKTDTGRRTKGPASKHLVPNYVFRPTVKAATVERCPDSQNQVLCRENRARNASSLELAVGECQTIEQEKWRRECFFQAAEGTLKGIGYQTAADLCLQTGDFQANCFMHLSYAFAEDVPPAIVTDEAEWKPILEHNQSIFDYWRDKDPLFGEAMQEQMWGKALDISYTKAGIVAGNPFEYLPVPSWPHIRAAAAFHLLQMEGAEAFGLEEWAKRTQRALEARLPSTAMRPPRPYQRSKINVQWSSDGRNDSQIPATYYMTDGRRTFSQDEHEDLLICILEGAARVRNGHKLVQEGLNHPSSLVQWTARRLSKE